SRCSEKDETMSSSATPLSESPATAASDPQRSSVGQRAHQHGATGRVTGQAVFTQDVSLPDMLFAAVLRSPHAHAKITRIDVTRALASPGVRAVITAGDFPGIRYVHFGAKYSDRYPLAN